MEHYGIWNRCILVLFVKFVYFPALNSVNKPQEYHQPNFNILTETSWTVEKYVKSVMVWHNVGCFQTSVTDFYLK